MVYVEVNVDIYIIIIYAQQESMDNNNGQRKISPTKKMAKENSNIHCIMRIIVVINCSFL